VPGFSFFGSFEQHVFHKMRQTGLMGLFVAGSGIDG
jgi:hypothetical protein